MSFSTLPLSYCTNVHPGQTVDEVVRGLQDFTVPARKKWGSRIAAGLWLPASAVQEWIAEPRRAAQLRETLAAGDLVCYTLNTFPFGDFHSERVKEQVYVPDWSQPERLQYTADSARVLSALLPDGTEGSLSTVPLGFKGSERPRDFQERCISELLRLAVMLDELHDETGQVIRLAIEPEPCCVIETTAEAITFFDQLFQDADALGLLDVAQRHLGLCYDVCHQSVEFEDVAQSIQDLNRSGIRINKVHITCAIAIDHPGDNPDLLEELAQFVEPRYLHQTFARGADGRILQATDLTAELCASPPDAFCEADAWRIHFHVPVHQESLGGLGTTRGDLKRALAVVAELEYAPHLEVETYTWGVLPDGIGKPSLVDSLVQELSATQALLNSAR